MFNVGNWRIGQGQVGTLLTSAGQLQLLLLWLLLLVLLPFNIEPWCLQSKSTRLAGHGPLNVLCVCLAGLFVQYLCYMESIFIYDELL